MTMDNKQKKAKIAQFTMTFYKQNSQKYHGPVRVP